MIISGVTLTGVTVVDAPAVTSGLVYYLDIGNTASYSVLLYIICFLYLLNT